MQNTLGENGFVSIGLVENDVNNDVLWTWSFPSISAQERDLLVKKCCFDVEPGSVRVKPFLYGRFRSYWYYMMTTEVCEGDKLPRVKDFVLVTRAKDFHPEKYETFSKILCDTYRNTGDPAAVLQLYLSVLTLGSCKTKGNNGSFCIRDFEPQSAYVSSFKHVINTFKLETILIYTAMLLKKRVVVYHHNIKKLQLFLRALPSLVWHRQNWNVLYPYQDLSEEETADLKSTSFYVAAFLDASVEGRTDLYDLFINLAAVEMTIAPHAKEAFTMSKGHKDIALSMVRMAEDSNLSDKEVIKAIASKTRDLLEIAGNFAEGPKDKKAAPALENLLMNLAIAENMVVL